MEPHRGDQPEEEGVGAGPDLALPDDSEDDGVDRLLPSVLVQGIQLDQQDILKCFGLKFHVM